MKSKRIPNSRQAAKFLAYYDASQVRRLAEAGVLRRTKIGRDWLYDRSNVEQSRVQPSIARRKRPRIQQRLRCASGEE
jgi:hypothetical protein